MSVHAYSSDVILSDYLRTAAGLAMTLVPLLLLETAPVVSALLAVAAGLFALYGASALARHFTRIEVDDNGLHVRGPRRGDVLWRSLSGVRLTYYSTRRDRSNGWLQLTLHGERRRLRIDSRIEDFQCLATRAAWAAGANHLTLDPATIFNFRAIGVSAPNSIAVEGGGR